MPTLLRVGNFFIGLQKWILIITTSFILVSLVLTTVLRYIFKTGIPGLEELSLIPAFWMYFIGAAYGTYKKEHITADIVSSYITSEFLLKAIDVFISVITFVLSVIFMYWSFEYLLWSIQSGALSSIWKYPLYIPQSSIFICFLLMSFYTLIETIKRVKILSQNKKGVM